MLYNELYDEEILEAEILDETILVEKKKQQKTIEPKTTQQVIKADDNYELESVTIEAVTSNIDENITPMNIKAGVTVLGVRGNLEPDKPNQVKEIEPTTSEQTIIADTGYELEQVIVKAVNPSDYYKEEENITITPSTTTQNIIPENNKVFNKVVVEAIETEELTATDNGEFTPSENKFYNKVVVNVDKNSGELFVGTIERTITEIKAEDLKYISKIGQYAFAGCENLTKVVIPDTVTYIDAYAFYGCSKLKEIKFETTQIPTLVDANAFEDIDPNYVIYVPENLFNDWKVAEQWSTLNIGEPSVVYTVVIDKTNPDYLTNCTYEDDAVNFTPMSMSANPDTGKFNIFNGNGWENRFPFNAMRPCVIENEQVKGYINKNNFTLYEDGTPVNSHLADAYFDVMIEIPKIYYCIETIDDKIYVRISNNKVNDRFKCYAHVYDGIELKKIYLGAYHASPKTYNGVPTFFTSSGYLPEYAGHIAYTDYESYITQRGNKFRYMNFDQMTLFQCLFLLGFKSTNSHMVFARGITTGNSKVSGTADTSGMFSGGLTDLIPAKFCGIENIFGNAYTRIEGMFIYSMSQTQTYTIYRRDPYSTVPVNKEGVGYDPMLNPDLNGKYASNKFLVDPYGTTEHGFLPKTYLVGTNATYFCDQVDYCSHYGMFFGGDNTSGTGSGMFKIKSDPGREVTSRVDGYRLCFYPVE